MTPARHTALGVERNGKRIALIGGHRDGVSIRVDAGPYSPADVEHLIALLSEQLTNHRLKTAPAEGDQHDQRS